MRIKPIRRLVSFSIGSLFFLAACAQPIKKTTRSESRNDFADTESSATEVTTSPPVTQQDEARVAVILGPGGYKSWAHVGVIKELHRGSVPIHKIAGVEWGSLVAALYAQRGQVNEAEWKLYKLEKVDLTKTGFFSNRSEEQNVGVLRPFLAENLNMPASKTAIPFVCPSLRLQTGFVTWPQDQELSKTVEKCITAPPLFKPSQNEVAGLFSFREIVQKLKSEGFNVIIMVNVLGDGPLFGKDTGKYGLATQMLWDEVRRQVWQAKSEVTDFIDVPTKGISLTDFASRKLLVTAGEAAGERAAKNLANKYGF